MLQSLQYLKLSGFGSPGREAQITDAGLATIMGLTALTHLELRCCHTISGEGLLRQGCYLGKPLRASLIHVDFAYCKAIADVGLALMGNMTRLAHLDLEDCAEITDQGLHHLGNLTTLTYLELHAGSCTDEGLNSLGSLTRLTCQKITADDITDDGLLCLSRMCALNKLVVRDAFFFTGAGLGFMPDLGTLQSLDLVRCANISNEGMKYLTGMTSLTKLAFCESYAFSDVLLQYLTSMGSLRALCLSGDGCEDVTCKGLQYVGCCTALTLLRLDDCSAISAGFEHLDRLVFLSTLSLENCGITDDGVRLLSELASLKASLTYLSLAYCKHITGACLVHLTNFGRLSSLHLSDCNVSKDELDCFLEDMPMLCDM
ncbi:unnamed protein product [Ostreobium quekettii]|uniref:Uncharacterized protein n=1 Tax=Ostreobium quekettii TaxID=121088 RepID=A0A8S1JC46_9CHLO|nr:unnamed protein product [Ostreobium quekettii]